MTTFRIDRATVHDVPAILSLINELAVYEKLQHEVTATEEQLSRTLFSDKPTAEVVLAKSDDDTAGFALYFYNYSTFLGKPGIYLEDLYVKQDYRGHGIGKQLLSYLAALAIERDCGRLEWSVLDWNQPAIEFYHSIGAKSLNEWTAQRVTGEALQTLATGQYLQESKV